jgi:hypothetical protein
MRVFPRKNADDGVVRVNARQAPWCSALPMDTCLADHRGQTPMALAKW